MAAISDRKQGIDAHSRRQGDGGRPDRQIEVRLRPQLRQRNLRRAGADGRLWPRSQIGSRGATHILVDKATVDGRTVKSRFDFGRSYGRETFAVQALMDAYGRDLVLPAFFGKEPTAIKA